MHYCCDSCILAWTSHGINITLFCTYSPFFSNGEEASASSMAWYARLSASVDDAGFRPECCSCIGTRAALSACSRHGERC